MENEFLHLYFWCLSLMLTYSIAKVFLFIYFIILTSGSIFLKSLLIPIAFLLFIIYC
jgi:hypothetical protein